MKKRTSIGHEYLLLQKALYLESSRSLRTPFRKQSPSYPLLDTEPNRTLQTNNNKERCKEKKEEVNEADET